MDNEKTELNPEFVDLDKLANREIIVRRAIPGEEIVTLDEKEHKLNNWVDKDTQIVYIKKSQLPKIIFNSGFKPITALGLNSYRSNTNVEHYIRFNCDLLIFYDAEPSMFYRRG